MYIIQYSDGIILNNINLGKLYILSAFDIDCYNIGNISIYIVVDIWVIIVGLVVGIAAIVVVKLNIDIFDC